MRAGRSRRSTRAAPEQRRAHRFRPVADAGGRRPRHGDDENRRQADGDSHCGDHEPGASDREEHAGERRSNEHADALDPARDDVRRRQLVRDTCERRHERRHRRTGDRDRRRGNGGRAVCEPRVSVTEQDGGCRRQGRALCDVPREQDASGAAPVAGGRRNRRDDRSRHELDGRDDRRLRRAATAVRVDEHRDPRRPFGGVERGERELDPAQLPVAEDGSERTTDPPEHEPRIHRGHGYSGRRCSTADSTAAASDGERRITVSSTPSGSTSRTTSVAAVTVAVRGYP